MIDKLVSNRKYFFVFLLLVTVISVLPIFFSGLPYGGDLDFHLHRIDAISYILKNGYIGYPIYSNYLNNYGYASGLFYPDLFLYIPAFLNYIGFSLFFSYKVFIFIVKFLSLVSIYFCVKAINGKKSGIISVVLYAFSSYIFVDFFERGALAESLTIVFIPIVIRGLFEIFYGDCSKFYFLPFGLLGVLFSHIISMYLISFFVLFFILFNFKKINFLRFKLLFFSFLYFVFAGSHFLFPICEQFFSGGFYYSLQDSVLLKNSVPFIFCFFEFPYYSLMGKGFDRWIPCGIGVLYLFLIFYCFKSYRLNGFIKCIFYFAIVCVVFSTKFFWLIPFFNKLFSIIQFPFRIYILSTILFIIVFSFVFDSLSFKRLFFVSFLLFSFNLFYPFVNSRVYDISNNEISYGEYLPIEYDLNYLHLNNVYTDCPISYDIDYGIRSFIKYSSNCSSNSFELPFIYYKGYNVSVNGSLVDVYKSDHGLLKVDVSDKDGIIEIFYSGTSVYRFTKYLSFLAVLGGVIIYVKKR